MNPLEVDLSAAAFVAFNRTLRGIGVDAMSAADPGDPHGVGRTARPQESVLATFHTPILRRLLERALEAMDGAADPPDERDELAALLGALRQRRDVGTCVLLTSPLAEQ